MTKEEARHQVALARVHNWLALRLAKAGYPNEARRARRMRNFFLDEAYLWRR